MDIKELIEMKKAGKRIPDDIWKTLSDEDKRKLAKIGSHEGPSRNDWKWYALSDQIAKDFGSLPYNVLSGRGVKLSATSKNVSATSAVSQESPVGAATIATVNYVPTCGVALSETDAVNMAAVQLYTFVRHANSGAKVYEAADLMIYVLALKDIYGQFARIKRALGIINNYPIENRALPDGLLLADGIDAEDLRGNIAQYRGQLNVLATKINSWAIPKYFKAFMREAYIQSAVFADSSSIRGQFYLFHRTGFYYYSATASETGGSLVYSLEGRTTSGTPVVRSVSQLLANLKAQLDALYLDEDMITMSGDILKAFGQGNLYTVSQTSESYVVTPVMDEDILAQIENAMSFATSGNNYTQFQEAGVFDITQANQLLHWQPSITVPQAARDGILNEYIFNSHKDQPEYTDNLEWTRLLCSCKLSGSTKTLTSCGLELVLDFTIWTRNSGNSAATGGPVYSIYLNTTNALGLLLLMQFDWHPTIYAITIDSTGPVVTGFGADIKKYTVLAKSTVENMNLSANAATFYKTEGLGKDRE